MSWLRVILEQVRFATVALAVSTFPERVKRTGWPAVYASVAAHVVSGWVETFFFGGLFIVGFLSYGDRFTQTAGWTYVSHQPTLNQGDFFGVGVIGYLSYLLTPVAWFTVWGFGEGIVRALDAAISSRLLGMAWVALPWRGIEALGREISRRRLRSMLGPERPDEVVPGEGASAAPLVVLASRAKPWSENQVIEYHKEFFKVVRKRLVKRGRHFAFRYDFCRLDQGEVIRGVLVRYEPGDGPLTTADPSAGRGQQAMDGKGSEPDGVGRTT